jgi:hypothetical protein
MAIVLKNIINAMKIYMTLFFLSTCEASSIIHDHSGLQAEWPFFLFVVILHLNNIHGANIS